MPTLEELIAEHTKDGKRPDELRLGRVNWGNGWWFRPYFRTRTGDWYGIDRAIEEDAYHGSADGFELYTEPKPKVKRAQYLVHIKGYDPYITDTLHANEKSVQLRNLTGNPFVICERLTETEREFDE